MIPMLRPRQVSTQLLGLEWSEDGVCRCMGSMGVSWANVEIAIAWSSDPPIGIRKSSNVTLTNQIVINLKNGY
jgi:hypothetical protein